MPVRASRLIARAASRLGGSVRAPRVYGRRLFGGTGDAGKRYVSVPEERLEELVRAEVAYLASVPVKPLTLRQVLEWRDPVEVADYILKEGPKRLALRIRLLESLTAWHEVPELVQTHAKLNRWYRSFLLARGGSENMRDLVTRIVDIREDGREVVPLVAAGIHKLHRISPAYDTKFLDKWLDGFLLSRIGTNVLADHFVSITKFSDGGLARETGIVDSKCDATAACRRAAKVAAELCLKHTGLEPSYTVENYIAGELGPQPNSPCYFSYIPSYLLYIVLELLKNSFNATAKIAASQADVQKRPVQILVCRDERRVAIMVSDRAGGIPSDAGDRIWSYLYGAVARPAGTNDDAPPATQLAGYGVGLPISRLYARYLGGDLDVTSYPGYGTQAHVTLPRLDVALVEKVPTDDWLK